MQASSEFSIESTTQKKVIYNYRTEKGTYNDSTKTIELVVSPDYNFFTLEAGEMQSYTAKNIYFTKVMHYLDNQDLIGEVVTLHEDNMYTVFPLKLGANDATVIDTIINEGTTTAYKNITLNDVIPMQTNCKYYTTSEYSVYFFDKPIEILGGTDATELFTGDESGLSSYIEDNSAISYDLIPQANISMQSENDIYIDCSPTGASQEELDTYEVPINSRMTSDLGQKRMEEMTTNFFFFVILVAITYFISPTAYKLGITDYILLTFDKDKLTPSDVSGKSPERILHAYRKALDIIVLGFSFVLFCLLIGSNVMTGIIFAFFILMSMAVILDKSKLKENQQLKTDGGKEISMFINKADDNTESKIPFIWSFAGGIISKSMSNIIGLGIVIALWAIIITLYALKMVPALQSGLDLTVGLLICLFIGLTIGVQINMRNVFNNDKDQSKIVLDTSNDPDNRVNIFNEAYDNANQ